MTDKEGLKSFARVLKEEIKDMTLYDDHIDMEDIDEVIIAAYSLGQTEDQSRAVEIFEHIHKLRGVNNELHDLQSMR